MKIQTKRESSELICQIDDEARFAIVGLGGIGCVVLRYLSLFLNSLGGAFRLSLIDGDKYTHENATRQTFGQLGDKAQVQAEDTLRMLGGGRLSIVAIPEFVTVENVERLLRCDYIFMCVDDHGVRRLVSEHLSSEKVRDVVLFSGGNDGVEPPRQRGSYGNVQIFVKREGKALGPTITKFHPEIARAEINGPSTAPGCGEVVDSVPQILFTNVAVASAMLNAFLAQACGELTHAEVKLDTIEARMLPYFPFRCWR